MRKNKPRDYTEEAPEEIDLQRWSDIIIDRRFRTTLAQIDELASELDSDIRMEIDDSSYEQVRREALDAPETLVLNIDPETDLAEIDSELVEKLYEDEDGDDVYVPESNQQIGFRLGDVDENSYELASLYDSLEIRLPDPDQSLVERVNENIGEYTDNLDDIKDTYGAYGRDNRRF